ncbi:MAG: 2-oxoglutarate dehydrogenase E1 subunit family protein, partial [Acidimicrobiaceae bacterium]
MADLADRTQDFGANSWLVEEMYEQFRTDPASVSEAWREFFSDYRSMTNGAQTTAAPASPAPVSAPAPAVSAPTTTPAAAPATPAAVPVASDITPEPIRGVGAA